MINVYEKSRLKQNFFNDIIIKKQRIFWVLMIKLTNRLNKLIELSSTLGIIDDCSIFFFPVQLNLIHPIWILIMVHILITIHTYLFKILNTEFKSKSKFRKKMTIYAKHPTIFSICFLFIVTFSNMNMSIEWWCKPSKNIIYNFILNLISQFHFQLIPIIINSIQNS